MGPEQAAGTPARAARSQRRWGLFGLGGIAVNGRARRSAVMIGGLLGGWGRAIIALGPLSQSGGDDRGEDGAFDGAEHEDGCL